MKKMAILRITPEVLRNILQLPDNCEVVRVDTAFDCRGVIEVVLEGVGWDTAEGMAILRCDHAVMTDGKIDWRFPENK